MRGARPTAGQTPQRRSGAAGRRSQRPAGTPLSNSAAEALPPAPWAECDEFVEKAGLAPAEGLDPVEDSGLAVVGATSWKVRSHRRSPSSNNCCTMPTTARRRARLVPPGSDARCRTARRGSVRCRHCRPSRRRRSRSSPMVRRPRRRASSRARSTFTESPLVEKPMAISDGSGVGDDLAGEDQIEPDVVGEAVSTARIVDQRHGRRAGVR